MNRTFTFLIIVSSLGGLGACSGERPLDAQAPQVLRHVSLIDVQKRNVPDLLSAVGTVRAAQTTVLAAQMMGNIVEIRVHEGERVRRGQTLAVIDESQPRAALDRAIAAGNASHQQLAAAETDLALAESTLKRFQALYERKSVSPQEFDEIKARQQAALARRDMARADQAQAKAALAQAQTTLSYTTIRAPFDGVVTEKKIDSGVLASPGMPLFTVEAVGRYRLEASVNETDLAYVRIGQAAPVLIDALAGSELKGKVVEVVPAADPASRTFLVKVELPPDARLRSGLFGHAEFARGQRESVLVPRSAIVERGQLQAVFVLDQNRVAALHYVTLGKPVKDDIEVLAGLESGDRLVATPGNLELDGKRIEAQ
ncbi:MAG TPA: efflux RND transporter periplasmic adaptor subunit [Candidatus Sulfotelmatobacter sp.]|nr:efflux RND transporter periplasmic adaptor subunit [Candidatus Sulfotelmatobacter sp.]